MKSAGIFALAASLVIVLTGCDAIRASLGKPTSKDIEALRQQKAQMQRTADSLAVAIEAEPAGDTVLLAESLPADSIPAEPSVSNFVAMPDNTPAGSDETPAVVQEAPAEPEPEPAPAGLAEGFYAVIGSFKNESNAKYLYNSISASGTPVEMVKMKNGFTAVMICHGATYDEAYRGMRDFYEDKKCPEGIWIYNTAKKLHQEQQ